MKQITPHIVRAAFLLALSSSTALAANMVSIDTDDANPTYLLEQSGDNNKIDIDYNGDKVTADIAQIGSGNITTLRTNTKVKLKDSTLKSKMVGENNTSETHINTIDATQSGIRVDEMVQGNNNAITNSMTGAASNNTTVIGNYNTLQTSGSGLGSNTSIINGNGNNVSQTGMNGTTYAKIDGSSNNMSIGGTNIPGIIGGGPFNIHATQTGNYNRMTVSGATSTIKQIGDSNSLDAKAGTGGKVFIQQSGISNRDSLVVNRNNSPASMEGNDFTRYINGNRNIISSTYDAAPNGGGRAVANNNSEMIIVHGNDNKMTTTGTGLGSKLIASFVGSNNTVQNTGGTNVNLALQGANNNSVTNITENGIRGASKTEIQQYIRGDGNNVNSTRDGYSAAGKVYTTVRGNNNYVNNYAKGALFTNLRMEGDNNRLETSQLSSAISSADESSILLDMKGSRNNLSLNQYGRNDMTVSIQGDNNGITANQSGTGNFSLVGISGSNNGVTSYQMGNYNVSAARVEGTGNSMYLMANGWNNQLNGEQRGNNNMMEVTLNGDRNIATFIQHGNNKNMHFQYTGNNLGAGTAGGAKIIQQ